MKTRLKAIAANGYCAALPSTVLASILLALTLAACNRGAPITVQLDPPVRVVSVNSIVEQHTATATGQVRLGVESPLAFKTAGIIAQMQVDAGQQVVAGQTLATLVMTDLDMQRTQAREQLAKTERDLARTESLRAKGMISQQVEQDARAQREMARAALTAANFNHEQAVITAPSNGLILEKRADARETVAAGQAVVIFGRLDKGWVVRAGLPAKDAVRINVGDAVQVQLDTATADAAALPGKVRRIAAASDPRTGSVELEVALPATKSRLVSGMVARLEFSIGSAKQDGNAGKNASDKNPTMSLPLAAVLEGNAGRAVVFILAADKKKVQRIEVKTGRLIDGGIEILDGLPSGAQVVSEGAAWLSDGDSVRVLP